MDVGSVENLVDQGRVLTRRWLPFCTLRGKRMYGYAASALRFSLVHTVSHVSTGPRVVGYHSHFGWLRGHCQQNRVAIGRPLVLTPLSKWYGVGQTESNPKLSRLMTRGGWKSRVLPPNREARSAGNAEPTEETVDFLHPIDATAVMRGSSDLPCSTRSVC